MGAASESRTGVPAKADRKAAEGATDKAPPPLENADLERRGHIGFGSRNFSGNADLEANIAGSSAVASSSAMRPISLDGSDEFADSLSAIELTRRRYLRDKQMIRRYKRMYWALMEEVRARFRRYYWHYGRSPEEDGESGSEAEREDNEGAETSESVKKKDRDRCAFPGCKTKPMALTTYCHLHILSDPRQKLYKPCSFPIKSSQSGPVICGKPILCAPQLAYCPTHIQKSQKNVLQALRRAGLLNSSIKSFHRINAIVAEYVRQIQERRREKIRQLEIQKGGDEEMVDAEDFSGDDSKD